MIDIVNKDQCVVCGNCINACPQNCISFNEEFESFVYPTIDYNKCVKCEKCTKVCPALNIPKSTHSNEFYAVKNKNEDILKISSSGGIFYQLAKHIIEQGGFVVGAIFDNNINVKHIIIDKDEKISSLCGSKYVQSNIMDVFPKIEEKLKENKLVLFCGCPCQTAAVKTYFGEKYTNLLLVDFICHGTVSPIVFEAYKQYLEKKYKSKIVDFKFRDKTNGWLYSGPKVTFENSVIHTTPLYKDIYMQGYFNNLNVRRSCYYCEYKNYKSASDITMADFWGIQNLLPDFYNEMGNSALIINTTNGSNLWNEIKSNFCFIPVNKELILKENSGLEQPFLGDLDERNQYFIKAEKVGYIKPLEIYIKQTISMKIKRIIKIVFKLKK